LYHGLIIGFGSIGNYHCTLATGRYPQIAIVDSKSDAVLQAKSDYPEAQVATSLDALHETDWDWSSTVATIATWGPSHSKVITDLIGLGVTKILCEKPFVHSVAEGARILNLAKQNGVTLGVHHHRRYSGLAGALASLSKEHNLGEPVSVFVQGGAAGLVTNGIHHVDWASEVFGGWPISVTSTASSSSINPRSPDLEFYDGTAIWQYADSQELTISYTNMSSVGQSVRVFYRDGVAELDRYDRLTLLGRDPEEITRFPAVTRTGEASEVLFEGAPPGFLDVTEATAKLLDEIESEDVQTFPSEDALTVVGACIGALASGRDGVKVELPLMPNSQLGSEEWQIS